MRVRRLHDFALVPREAIRLQRLLAPRVVRRGPAPRRLRLVLGVDCAPRPGGRMVAAAVVWAHGEDRVVEERTAVGRPGMPYVPGLLSFREIPLLAEALGRVRASPDVVLVDGHGIAHPRRLGIAAHLGLLLDVPVIGVGKSRLTGVHDEPGDARGSRAPLVDRGERIGDVLRTRTGVKPVYVSVGNRIGLGPAVRVVLRVTGRYRLPEPIRAADHLSKHAKG